MEAKVRGKGPQALVIISTSSKKDDSPMGFADVAEG